MAGKVHIEIVDKSSMWRRIGSVDSHPTIVRTNLEQASKTHKTNARAVDSASGAVVDFQQHTS